MRQIKIIAAALLVMSPIAAIADPIDIDFSIDEDGQVLFGSTPVAGTVTGSIFGLVDNLANQMAGISVVINSFPFGLGGVIDNGLDTSVWDFVVGTGFSIFGGNVTAAQYGAQMGDPSGFPGTADQLRINFSGINALTFDGYVTSTGNGDGFPGTSFTAVPEPGTLTLFGIGLLGLGMARRYTA